MEHVACMCEMRNACKILVGKREGKNHVEAKNEWDVAITREAMYY